MKLYRVKCKIRCISLHNFWSGNFAIGVFRAPKSLADFTYVFSMSRLQSDFNVFLSGLTSLIDRNSGQFQVKSLWILHFKIVVNVALWISGRFFHVTCQLCGLPWLAKMGSKAKSSQLFPLYFKAEFWICFGLTCYSSNDLRPRFFINSTLSEKE